MGKLLEGREVVEELSLLFESVRARQRYGRRYMNKGYRLMSQLNSIVDKVVHPILEKYHLPLYHTNPEYHASFAWCLLDPANSAQAVVAADADGAVDIEDESQVVSTGEPPKRKTPLPPDLVDELGMVFGKQILAKQPDGGWEISDLILRAGKVLHSIPLA